jgi:hypothetical protein
MDSIYTQEYIDQIKKTIGDIKDSKLEEIFPQTVYGKLTNYPLFIDTFKRAQTLFSELYSCDLSDMQPDFVQTVDSWANSLHEVIQLAQKNDISDSPQPRAIAQQYMDKVQRVYQAIFEKFRIEIAYYNSSLHNFQSKISKLDDLFNKGVEYRLNFVEESDKILKDIRTAAAETAVHKFSNNFFTQATQHQRASYGWLIAGILFILSSFWFGFQFFDKTIKLASDATNSQIIQNAITKLFVISAVLSGIALCFKNYKANRHNYIINTHKVNSLNTFRLFVDSTEDITIRNAIITQAATSVFSIPSTGYISTEAENDSSNKIIEVIKNITNSKT